MQAGLGKKHLSFREIFIALEIFILRGLKMLRLFFRFRRSFLSSLSLAAVQALLKYFKTVSGHELMPGGADTPTSR